MNRTEPSHTPHPRTFVLFLQARLSPEGFLGLHLTVGLLLIVLACMSFYEIAEYYGTNGWAASMDRNAAEFFRQIMAPKLTRVVLVVTFLGSVGAVITMSVIVGIVLLLKRALYRFSALALTIGGGRVVAGMLKYRFHRARPAPEHAIVTFASYSFPSAHAMGTTLLCGSLAIIGAMSVTGLGKRAAFFMLAAVWVIVIGATRIYLGAHYLTDVIAGFTAGVAWLAICWTAMESVRRWTRRYDSFPGRPPN